MPVLIRPRSANLREQPSAIWAWWVFQGIKVPRMGRLPREAVEADEDHP
jgi:hypothetical protein